MTRKCTGFNVFNLQSCNKYFRLKTLLQTTHRRLYIIEAWTLWMSFTPPQYSSWGVVAKCSLHFFISLKDTGGGFKVTHDVYNYCTFALQKRSLLQILVVESRYADSCNYPHWLPVSHEHTGISAPVAGNQLSADQMAFHSMNLDWCVNKTGAKMQTLKVGESNTCT